MPWPLYPWERDLVPIVQEAGWAPGPDMPPPGFNPQTVQRVASCYINYAILAHHLPSMWYETTRGHKQRISYQHPNRTAVCLHSPHPSRTEWRGTAETGLWAHLTDLALRPGNKDHVLHIYHSSKHINFKLKIVSVIHHWVSKLLGDMDKWHISMQLHACLSLQNEEKKAYNITDFFKHIINPFQGEYE